MRTRKAASIEENPASPDPTLLWYSRAVGIMRTKRKFVDPTIWRFQGAVHDYNARTDPYLDPKDPPPSASILKKYGKQCQHSSWFFLSWHRMYLYFFEQIVANAVVEAGGPANWTLPFWDYGASAAARKLPWSFRQPTWPGGETNYLYVAQRADGINSGKASLSTADVESATALGMPFFSTAPTSSDVQFGGPRVKNHEGGTTYPFGGVESSPHNHVHVAVGGPTGFMLDPTTAALDPIFWLHHCNIDRLWEVWIRVSGHANPTETAWLKTVAFAFYDPTKKPVTMTSSQVVDTTKPGYQYDGLPPLPKKVKITPLPLARPRLSMVGATTESFLLRTDARHVTIPTPDLAPSSPADSTEHERVLLHLENITAKEHPGSYDVYVNVPAGQKEASHPERYAGRVSLFGAASANRSARSHAREGFSFVLDVTEIYRKLSASGEWDPAHLQVTLKPVYDWSDDVTVGRISVNVA